MVSYSRTRSRRVCVLGGGRDLWEGGGFQGEMMTLSERQQNKWVHLNTTSIKIQQHDPGASMHSVIIIIIIIITEWCDDDRANRSASQQDIYTVTPVCLSACHIHSAGVWHGDVVWCHKVAETPYQVLSAGEGRSCWRGPLPLYLSGSSTCTGTLKTHWSLF